MRNFISSWFAVVAFICFSSAINAQPVGYYNGVEGKSDNELKQVLNEKISGHVDFSYSFSKNIINYSDSDPANGQNVILFYLQESRDASNYGTGGDYINREHVWAKSHGDFSGIRPMDSDAHNLRPADASVNQDRSNKDFDNVYPNGTQHKEATACWYNTGAWEPGNATKGQVARILFYMATRYEGNDSKIDLELVDKLFTAPDAEHGKLSTLLEWNRKYPPSDFERRRNERLYSIQQNRNPFVDHPEFANFIWNDEKPSGPQFSNFKINPEICYPGDQINLSLDITHNNTIENVKLFWGNEFNSEDNQVAMSKNGDNFSAMILPEGFKPEEMIYFSVQTTIADSTYSWSASHLFPEDIDSNLITPIHDVQGTGDESPLKNQEVVISGRVTANYDHSFYMQTTGDKRNGINVYNTFFRGKIGDSLVVRGKIDEYNNLTELLDVTYLYNFKKNNPIEPKIITTNDFNEDNEGILVTLKGVTFTNGGKVIPEENASYIFNDQYGSGVAFISYSSRLTGKYLTSGKADITGILSQYMNTYQLLPRNIDDIKIVTKSHEFTDQQNSVSFYPNPFKNELHIDSKEKIKQIIIYNSSGQLILNETDKLKTINTNSLNSGLYILEVIFDDFKTSKSKIVKLD